MLQRVCPKFIIAVASQLPLICPMSFLRQRHASDLLGFGLLEMNFHLTVYWKLCNMHSGITLIINGASAMHANGATQRQLCAISLKCKWKICFYSLWTNPRLFNVKIDSTFKLLFYYQHLKDKFWNVKEWISFIEYHFPLLLS